MSQQKEEKKGKAGLFVLLRLLAAVILITAFVFTGKWLHEEDVAFANSMNKVTARIKEVPADKIDPALEGELVMVHGNLINTEPELHDELFDVTVKGIALVRVVEEMTSVQNGSQGTKTENWSALEGTDPSNPLITKAVRGKNYTLGAYMIEPELVRLLHPESLEPLKIPYKTVQQSPAFKKLRLKALEEDLSYLHLATKPEENPVRISFHVLPSPSAVTIVAMQKGTSLVQKEDKLFDPKDKAIILPGELPLGDVGVGRSADANPFENAWLYTRRFLAWIGMFVSAAILVMVVAGKRLVDSQYTWVVAIIGGMVAASAAHIYVEHYWK